LGEFNCGIRASGARKKNFWRNMNNKELKVISDCYKFVLYMERQISKFPRNHRYVLGADIEKRIQLILAKLIEAKYSEQKYELLRKSNIELEILRFQLRLCKDLNLMKLRSCGYAIRQLTEIGSQVGGWTRSIGANSEKSRQSVV